MKRVIYVAGPYRGKSIWWLINRVQRWVNIWKARKVAKTLWWNGLVAICPHLNTVWMDTGDAVKDWEIFIGGDLVLLSKSDYILMLENWEKSEGAIVEHKFAITHNIPIFYQKEIESLIKACITEEEKETIKIN
jgi:hypothetical protein